MFSLEKEEHYKQLGNKKPSLISQYVYCRRYPVARVWGPHVELILENN